MSGSGSRFSEQEMMRTQGQPAVLIAGNRITLFDGDESGLMRARWAFNPSSAIMALSTIAFPDRDDDTSEADRSARGGKPASSRQ